MVSKSLKVMLLKCHTHVSKFGKLSSGHRTRKQSQRRAMLKNFQGQLSCSVLTLATPWTVARQASLSITNSQSLFKLMSIESVMPSNHLILCHPLLLLPSTFTSIRVFSKDSVLRIRWPKDCSFSFSISPSNEYPGLISFRTNQFDLLAVKGLSTVFSSTIVQKHQFFGAQLSLWSSSQCLNYCTVVLISHASRVILKILQARFQQYMNQELLSNVQAGFGKFK